MGQYMLVSTQNGDLFADYKVMIEIKREKATNEQD